MEVNFVKLLLPLNHYDEAGRVKPPLALYWVIFFLCRSLVILGGALSSGEYSNELLSLFYGDSRFVYLNFVIAIPALVSLLIIGFREKLWEGNKLWLFTLIKPLMIFSSLADVIFHAFSANLHHWQFSWVIAATLIVNVLCLYFLAKDKHITFMVIDWRNVTVDTSNRL